MGLLLRTLVAVSSEQTAGFGVPSSVPKWRTRHDWKFGMTGSDTKMARIMRAIFIWRCVRRATSPQFARRAVAARRARPQPSTGFKVSCFPVKIERASAGWTRAVAILES